MVTQKKTAVKTLYAVLFLCAGVWSTAFSSTNDSVSNEVLYANIRMAENELKSTGEQYGKESEQVLKVLLDIVEILNRTVVVEPDLSVQERLLKHQFEYNKRALLIARKLFGNKDPKLIQFLLADAMGEIGLGDAVLGINSGYEALSLLRSIAPTSPVEAVIWDVISDGYEELGRYVKAEETSLKALDIVRKNAKERDQVLLQFLGPVSGLYLKNNKLEKAKEIVDEAIWIANESLNKGGSHLDGLQKKVFVNMLLELGMHYTYAGNFSEAKLLYESLIKFDRENEEVYIKQIAGINHESGENDDSISELHRSLDLYIDEYGSDSPVIVRLLFELSQSYSNKGDYKNALEYGEKALFIVREYSDLFTKSQYVFYAPVNKYVEFGPDISMQLASLALVYLSLGGIDNAQLYNAEALDIARELDNNKSDELLKYILASAMSYAISDKYKKAIPLYDEAIEIVNAGGSDEQKLKTFISAAPFFNSFDSDKAYDLYSQALESIRKIQHDHPDRSNSVLLLSSMASIARYYSSIGVYSKAERLMIEVINRNDQTFYFSPEQQQKAAAGYFADLGGIHVGNHSYNKALSAFNDGIDVYRKLPFEPGYIPAIYLMKARLLIFVGDYVGAEKLLLELIEKKTATDQQRSYYYKMLGDDYSHTGKLDLAKKMYSESIKLKPSSEALISLAGISILNEDDNGNYVYFKGSNNYAELDGLYKQALSLVSDNSNELSYDHAYVSSKWADFLSQTGRAEKAREIYSRSILVKILYGKDSYLEKNRLCVDYLSKSQFKIATFYCKLAVNELQMKRGSYVDLEYKYKKHILGNNFKVYVSLIESLIPQGRWSEVQQVLKMINEDEYQNFVSKHGGSQTLFTYAEYSDQELKWKAMVDEFFRSHMDKYNVNREALEKINITKHNLAEWLQLMQAMEKGFNEKKMDISELSFTTATQDIVNTLRSYSDDDNSNTILIQRVPDKIGIRLLITDRYGTLSQVLIKLTADKNALVSNNIRDLLLLIEDPKSNVIPVSSQVYKTIIQPIEEHLDGVSTILWSLGLRNTLLQQVPMAALYDGEQYLIEKYNMFRYTSAVQAGSSDAIHSYSEGFGVSRNSNEFLVNGKQIYFSELPGVEKELDVIIKDVDSIDSIGELRGKVHLNGDFTRETLNDALKKKPGVVHIASHFILGSKSKYSYLLTGEVSAEDPNRALLSLDEIDKNISFTGVDLLALSACETGKITSSGSGSGSGLELEGLGVVAQRKGANAVLATLWPVADTSTSEFMQTFYRLRGGERLSKSEAIRAAQMAMIKSDGSTPVVDSTTPRGWSMSRGIGSVVEYPDGVKSEARDYSHPYYWAPFILMGNGS